MSTNERITVSEDRLRAVIAELKYDLITELGEKFDRKADLAMLTEARKTIESQGEEIESLQRWQSWIMGGLAVCGVAVGVLASVVVAVLT